MAAKKTKIKAKTMISYIQIDAKQSVHIIVVSKAGEITKIDEKDEEALVELKKFVNAL